MKKKSYIIICVYDGEFYFLKKQVVGNGPKRHYSKLLTDEFVKPFKEGCYKVDVLSCQLNINLYFCIIYYILIYLFKLKHLITFLFVFLNRNFSIHR